MRLLGLIKERKVNTLVGLSGVPGLFDESIIKSLDYESINPLVFSLSSPGSRFECTF